MRRRSPDSSSDDSDGKWERTCSRLKRQMSELHGLGGKVKPHPGSHNRFAGFQSDPEDEAVSDAEHATPAAREREDSDPLEADGDGFETVQRKKKSDTETISLWRTYTEKECQVFSDMYNAYFMALTGEHLGFIITPSSQPYVSVFEACMERDFLLSTLFNKRPVIIDPMGGCGSDSCAMLFNLYPKSLWVCEYILTTNERRQATEYSILEKNMKAMVKSFKLLDPEQTPGAPELHTRNMDCREFLLGLEVGFHVDILYLDPNWVKGGADNEVERTPEEMVDYIREFVIEPLTARQIFPKCIVYKTRYLTEMLWPVMKVLSPDYHPMYSIEAQPFRTAVDEAQFKTTGAVKGRFHWAVIVHNELRTEHWHKSQVYKDLLFNGKDVLIAKEDLIGPNQPMYTKRYRKPVEADRADGRDTILVRAPKRPRRQIRDTHAPKGGQRNVGTPFHSRKGRGGGQQNARPKR